MMLAKSSQCEFLTFFAASSASLFFFKISSTLRGVLLVCDPIPAFLASCAEDDGSLDGGGGKSAGGGGGRSSLGGGGGRSVVGGGGGAIEELMGGGGGGGS
jgi:hypothetical protein